MEPVIAQSLSIASFEVAMKKFVPYFLIVFLTFSLLGAYQSARAGGAVWHVLAPKANKVDSSVQVILDNSAPGDMLTVIVMLDKQADLSRVNGVGRAARLQGVIQALQATANLTQGRLTGLLNTYRSQGQVESFTPLWVFNSFSVTATVEVINTLVQDPDVYSVTPDNIQIVPTYGTPEANISLINAPALWDQGITGQGVVVASMDSGVDVSHPDLSSRWRGGSNSWYDPYGQHATPVDLSGHGTWTTGIMVGGDAGGTSIGVAPDAQWIAAKIFNDAGSSTATAIHQSFQWLLDPDGNPNTADAPQVVNNSWTYANPGCYLDFEPDLESLRAAGILPVFAAGNGGPSSNTSYSPSNNPAAFAVGAVDNNDQIYAYSSRGPSTCGGSTGPFPEMVAPGVNVRTTELYGLYATETGTSLAAPHVAGGLALLLSAYPNLDSGMQEQALINTAVDLGASSPDDEFGYGRLDLFSAFNWAASAPTSTPPPPTATTVPTDTPTLTPTLTDAPNVNLALNRPVTVSSFQDADHGGDMAVDGSLSTQWQTEKAKGKNRLSSEWIEVDLGSVQDVSQVILEWDAYFATTYSIDVSNYGNTWSMAASTSNGDGGNDTLTFNTVQARYVRMNFTGWSNNSYNNWLNELEVYPLGDTTSPTATETATPIAMLSLTPTEPATSTLSPTPTNTPTSIPTPDNSNSLHIGDLDDTSTSNGGRWNAIVMVTVHDSSEMSISGVTISGTWSNGATGGGTCTTGSDGTCSISRNNLKNNVNSVDFAVTNLSGAFQYQSSGNHDPDGDSNGTMINLMKP
jgi:subtilisin family serine protease